LTRYYIYDNNSLEVKNQLPNTKNTKGFTLVELLVVITVIAILSIIGLTVFSGLQKSARDAKRRADVDAIAKALEIKYAVGVYTMVVGTDFAAGAVPTDPQGTAGYTYNTVIPAGGASYTVCAHLEKTGTGNSTTSTGTAGAGDYYCQKNQQ
jgi:prepilin-type N-terminal cleavage/methylation domain-containing protein